LNSVFDLIEVRPEAAKY